ncbi:hypothetical protein A176_003867 [Myxococcus hansupus]|uniref:DUF418 domain-containing protein n=1 Tax=Pseudomyxococcus hansupus TaxID=1297742 RepID=A0A0H4X023_9BACT|nr:hypothetical protein A176_003867 [Myxococcus hansupus]
MVPASDSAVQAAPAEARPVDASERLELLDALRGFALLGVFVSNVMMWFSGRVFRPPEVAEAADKAAPLLDSITQYAYEILVSGKFITLFAFLFGLGFAVQLGRAEARGASIAPLYARRLVVLFGIGLMHLFLLWYGDILASYAVMGFGLLLLRRRSARTLLIVAAALCFVWPIIQIVIIRLPRILADTPEAGAAIMKAARERSLANQAELLAVITQGSWLNVVIQNARYYIADFLPMIAVSSLSTLGRFVLGLWAGQQRIFHDVSRHLRLFRRMLGWGLVAGVVGSSAGLTVHLLMRFKVYTPETLPLWIPYVLAPLRNLAQIGFAAAYVACITLLFQRTVWQRVLSVLAPAGRMALTNYLSQTVISLLVFYGFGLGQVSKHGPFACVVFCLSIFCVQVLWSHLWLARFRFGPVEWVWRSLTYGKAQPMRRSSSDSPPSPMAA